MDEVEKSFRLQKTEFLDGVQQKVNTYIVSRRRNCLAVVERNDDGSIWCTWDFDDDLDDLYKHVYYFMRKKKSKDGRMHDSALTDPITQIVADEYERFYASQQDNIATGVVVALKTDEVKLQDLVERITEMVLASLSKNTKDQVGALLKEQIKTAVVQGGVCGIGHLAATQIGHVASIQIGHLATTTTGTKVGTLIASLLLKLIVAKTGTMLSKVLASAAFKKVLAILTTKLLVTAVTAAVLKVLAVHIGAAVGSAGAMVVVVPLIMGFMTYKIRRFPKKLGEKVSKSVRDELDERFENLNMTILENLLDSVFNSNELVHAIADNDVIRDWMRSLGEKLESKLAVFKDSNYTTLSEKKMKPGRIGYFKDHKKAEAWYCAGNCQT